MLILTQQLIAQEINNPVIGPGLAALNGVSFFQKLLPALILFALIIGVIIFFFMLIIGAVQWISSGGDKVATQSARGRITNAIVGLVILLSFFAITQLLGTFFGIDILRLNIQPLFIGGGAPPGPDPTPAPTPPPGATVTPIPPSVTPTPPLACLGCYKLGVCFPGTDDRACGTGGVACLDCVARFIPNICVAGACQNPVVLNSATGVSCNDFCQTAYVIPLNCTSIGTEGDGVNGNFTDRSGSACTDEPGDCSTIMVDRGEPSWCNFPTMWTNCRCAVPIPPKR